jgi:hypothetical protein
MQTVDSEKYARVVARSRRVCGDIDADVLRGREFDAAGAGATT